MAGIQASDRTLISFTSPYLPEQFVKPSCGLGLGFMVGYQSSGSSPSVLPQLPPFGAVQQFGPVTSDMSNPLGTPSDQFACTSTLSQFGNSGFSCSSVVGGISDFSNHQWNFGGITLDSFGELPTSEEQTQLGNPDLSSPQFNPPPHFSKHHLAIVSCTFLQHQHSHPWILKCAFLHFILQLLRQLLIPTISNRRLNHTNHVPSVRASNARSQTLPKHLEHQESPDPAMQQKQLFL